MQPIINNKFSQHLLLYTNMYSFQYLEYLKQCIHTSFCWGSAVGVLEESIQGVLVRVDHYVTQISFFTTVWTWYWQAYK